MQLMRGEVPTFLSLDVEPDGFQSPNLTWTGFEEMHDLIGRLRPQLRSSSGVAPRFCWYLRMDPQVAAAHGRADHVAVAYREHLIGSRLAKLPVSDEVRALVQNALLWVWKDEEMHTIYIRGALLRMGSPA